MEQICVCNVSFGNQYLGSDDSDGVFVSAVTDDVRVKLGEAFISDTRSKKACESISIKSLDSLKEPALKSGVKNLRMFLSKSFSQNQSHLFFMEAKPVKIELDSDSMETVSTFRSEKKDSDTILSDESVSVFGSPLRLQSIANLSLNETSILDSSKTYISESEHSSLQGLPIHEARKMLSKFCQCRDQNNDRASLLNSIAILCNGEDPSNTLLLGAHHDDGNMLTTFKVTFNSKKCSLAFLEPLDLQDDMCQMSSSFDLLDHRDKNRQLSLEVQWTDSNGHSVISNLQSAQFFLHISKPFGCKDSLLQEYFYQLKHIRMLNSGLKDGKLPSQLSNTPYDATGKLQEIFLQIKNGDLQNSSAECRRVKRISLQKAKTSDFTDQLWDVFLHSETYQDMIACLKMTFNVLKKNEFPLFVHKDNDTMLARLVRQSSKGLIYYPPLTGLLPIKMIAELGLQNMKKLYTSILIENELCSSAELEDFCRECLREDVNVSPTNLEQDDQINEAVFETVEKLHHTLDILCTVDSHSKNLNLQNVASHILNYFKNNSLTVEHTHRFVVPVSARQALQESEKLLPSLVRREYDIHSDTHIDCFLSELPDSLTFPMLIHTDKENNVSTLQSEDTKECYQIKTEEIHMTLGRSL